MEEKFKPLNKKQIIISLDRLTRFKHSEDKYTRVFKDIITSNLIAPKYKKTQLDSMDYEKLKNIAQYIFNESLKSFDIEPSKNYAINKKLFEYENQIFKLNAETNKLLRNEIEFESALKLIDDKNTALNIKWLKSLCNDANQNQTREENSLGFPLTKIIITEGITEEILLPNLSKLIGCDFDKHGIKLISAGGKNQVVKLFYQYADILKLPIFVLLDADAKDNLEEIKPKLRKVDKVHIIKNGEFEDILPLNLIKRTLNRKFKNFSSVKLEDLRKDLPMTKILDGIFKEKSVAEFKKAEFAALVTENLESKNDVSEEIREIIKEITEL